MKADTSLTLVPRRRFPEFRDAEEWEPRKLGDIADFFKGKGLPKSMLSPDGTNQCIHYGELFTTYTEVIRTVNSRTNLDGKLFLSVDDDVLMPTSDVTPNGLAKACCIKLRDVIIGGDVLVIRTDQRRVGGEFLARYIRHLERKVLQLVTGSTVYHLYATSLEKLDLCVPNQPEQQKIADCLGSLDDLIAAEGRQLEALRQHKQGLMQQLFPQPGETAPRLRFPDFQNAGAWEEEKLDDLARRGTGHTPKKAIAEYYNGGIKWVSLADSKRLDNGLISETEIEISEEGINNSSAVLHPAGSVILSRDAGVGKSAIISCSMAVSQHFIVWTCEPTVLSNWFLYYQLQLLKPLFERIATGSTIKTIGLPFFNAMRVTVPRLAEQHRIADCLSMLDARLAAQVQKLNALKTHKQGLLQQLFPPLESQ